MIADWAVDLSYLAYAINIDSTILVLLSTIHIFLPIFEGQNGCFRTFFCYHT